ncbi:G protein-coupled receptor, rhodopsin-like family and GPCR, rhodopsin-like, 7TM domain-containing protein [Strongyloides ratti]|uniref:G protein-coupled receptor, rhodopsin-like family and GPCR, rhodopsin-like, 7TM domain-containing protein n=1 Tax=Strongyloides ratti TaxID=34506 RepID=A0A090KSC1_STRRB|nr:G protein-coupled receptor, rhodopsin-like family and GPCR, rhodopsin-like, 7TM domain-containing protein [Strongyloides ratti]CEF60291.1 G protein-coupled receptor, rhodopsin-like family and GPCR, rhodopsin-like, 7TM domain-containing protein [Strongyloides ratti]
MNNLVYLLGFSYFITVLFGFIGNLWVIFSVIRSWRPRNSIGFLNPSDRLRSYIGGLAVVDLIVILLLLLKLIYLLLPNITVSNGNCRTIFLIDNIIRLASLTCLFCISVERLITIKKPFSTNVRRHCIKFLPYVAGTIAIFFLIIIIMDSLTVIATNNYLNCGQKSLKRMGIHNVISTSIPITYIILTTFVSLNYLHIIRHVRRKFWKRKSRVCANTRSKNPLISEPKYMKGMTWSIVTVAVFHLFCLIPYCIIRLLPDIIWKYIDNDLSKGYIHSQIRPLIQVNSNNGLFEEILNFKFLVLFVNWLTYTNSAGNWIFYAALNRQLRSLIRATTERRKRSTLSQITSPLAVQHSLKRQVAQSLRFFSTLNSHKTLNDSINNQNITNGIKIEKNPRNSDAYQNLTDADSLSHNTMSFRNTCNTKKNSKISISSLFPRISQNSKLSRTTSDVVSSVLIRSTTENEKYMTVSIAETDSLNNFNEEFV